MSTVPPPADPDDGGRRRPGRPTKLTDELWQLFVELLLEGCFRSTACRNLGVGKTTFTRWMQAGKRYPRGRYGQFRAAVEGAEARAEANALRLILAAGKKDPKYLVWWLERKYPGRYGQCRGELSDLKRKLCELEKEVGKAVRDLGLPNDAIGESDGGAG
ncbi:helix-turn-helix domain-containing protein [Limnoglobus roseus]|uniref:Uncharacterized protein n=1 Tax=Limnoglobus roseus TaxID=2598579 RepID=A0A5C1ATB3_9BACT|nr:hypothetical protein [Limnoglobus roseus]QEL20444.1 hypothetical protein PX52LOC_07542 [Limnoglobus roseus]